ncbi:MAG: isoprenyl transferase [Candidatus Omnitrophica bacterium]|nr:isoprenyl transferase [Candidatus Omnitrophota bacterium]
MSKEIVRSVPEHIALIMDGNGRWAQRRHLPRLAGHRQGVETIKKILTAGRDRGVKYLTFYAFSTENWKRPAAEVNFLMQLLKTQLRKEIRDLQRRNVRMRAIGDIRALPAAAQQVLAAVCEQTSANDGITMILALNYGSRQEIVRAALALSRDIRAGRVEEQRVGEDLFSGYLDTAGIPDPELLIRTSGEMRLSNFLLWQLSYAELYMTEKCWPEFEPADLDAAIAAFQKRQRRFGGL